MLVIAFLVQQICRKAHSWWFTLVCLRAAQAQGRATRDSRFVNTVMSEMLFVIRVSTFRVLQAWWCRKATRVLEPEFGCYTQVVMDITLLLVHSSP